MYEGFSVTTPLLWDSSADTADCKFDVFLPPWLMSVDTQSNDSKIRAHLKRALGTVRGFKELNLVSLVWSKGFAAALGESMRTLPAGNPYVQHMAIQAWSPEFATFINGLLRRKQLRV